MVFHHFLPTGLSWPVIVKYLLHIGHSSPVVFILDQWFLKIFTYWSFWPGVPNCVLTICHSLLLNFNHFLSIDLLWTRVFNHLLIYRTFLTSDFLTVFNLLVISVHWILPISYPLIILDHWLLTLFFYLLVTLDHWFLIIFLPIGISWLMISHYFLPIVHSWRVVFNHFLPTYNSWPVSFNNLLAFGHSWPVVFNHFLPIGLFSPMVFNACLTIGPPWPVVFNYFLPIGHTWTMVFNVFLLIDHSWPVIYDHFLNNWSFLTSSK